MHYLNQFWPLCIGSYVVNRPQWVNQIGMLCESNAELYINSKWQLRTLSFYFSELSQRKFPLGIALLIALWRGAPFTYRDLHAGLVVDMFTSLWNLVVHSAAMLPRHQDQISDWLDLNKHCFHACRIFTIRCLKKMAPWQCPVVTDFNVPKTSRDTSKWEIKMENWRIYLCNCINFNIVNLFNIVYWTHLDLMMQVSMNITLLFWEMACHLFNGRNHFVYAPSQWETMLHCNMVSH